MTFSLTLTYSEFKHSKTLSLQSLKLCESLTYNVDTSVLCCLWWENSQESGIQSENLKSLTTSPLIRTCKLGWIIIKLSWSTKTIQSFPKSLNPFNLSQRSAVKVIKAWSRTAVVRSYYCMKSTPALFIHSSACFRCPHHISSKPL